MQLAISQGDQHRANKPMVTKAKFLMTTQLFAEPRSRISTDYVTNTKGQLDSRNERRKMQQRKNQLLRALAKLRKATLTFVMSVGPSVRPSAWNNSVPA
jgi:hypothetical protein